MRFRPGGRLERPVATTLAFVTVCGLASVVAACGERPTAAPQPASSAVAAAVHDPGRVTPAAAVASAPASGAVAKPASGSAAQVGGAAAAKPTVQPSPAPSAPQYAEGTRPAPATATLDAPCVAPGGTETIRVHSRPLYAYTFDAQYADGNDGRKYGGVGTGRLDSSGDFVASWIVQPGTPAGNVIVWVSVAGRDESAFRQPTFAVNPSC